MNKPTPYFTIVLGVLLLIVIWAVLMLVTGIAYAQAITPDSACGSYATGKRPADDVLFSGAVPNQRVGPDGYWRACEAPVSPPGGCDEAPRATWTQGPHKCVGDQARPALRDGGTAFSFVEQTPGTVGYLMESCKSGVRSTLSARCHNRCVTHTTITRGACNYEYKPRGLSDALSAGESMPAGRGRCAAMLVCVGGGNVELVSR